MQTIRDDVSHALQRKATLDALRRPQPTLSAPVGCDADPLLVRSAVNHGEPAEQPCPVCESQRMLVLHHVFGDQLGQYSGRIKSPAELSEMENQFGEFTVRVVEVCPDCRWNHLIRTFVLGDGIKRRRPRREPTVEDLYG